MELKTKERFMKMLKAKEEQRAALKKELIESDDKETRAAIGETLINLENEIKEVREMMEELDEPAEPKEPQGDEGEGQRGMNPMQTMGMRNGQPDTKKNSDPLATPEYRKAFMEFATKGTPIAKELRENTNTTKTTDASAAIPTTLLNEIVKELKSYGNVYSQVRKLNVQGGVDIPILSLKPTATWITADAGESESTTQKIKANTKVSFSYYGLECKLSQTLLTNVTTIEIFEEQFATLAVEAIAKALDIAIMNGTGTGEPLGVTVDTRVPNANIITLSSADFATWEGWKKKVFAKMKKSYRDGKFFMSQATFDGYIDGMVADDGQPIARVNYGITDGEQYRFGGKEVETVEDDVISAYEDASTGDVVAVFMKPTDYAINSNLEMQTVKWVDHDTNEIKNKVIMICDGKLVDPNGVLIIKKGA